MGSGGVVHYLWPQHLKDVSGQNRAPAALTLVKERPVYIGSTGGPNADTVE
jgi:hypothetical protein